MAQQGMFGGLFQEPKDPFDTTDAYRYAQIANPNYREGAFRRRQGENMVQAGVEQAVSAFSGEPKREQAATALRELAKVVKPGTKVFFQRAADILAQHGLVEEAATMQAKYDAAAEAERKQQADELGLGSSAGDIARLQKQRDALSARLDAGDQRVVPALDAIDRELAAKGTSKASTAASPETITLLAELKRHAPGSPEHTVIQQRLAALGYTKGMATGGAPARDPATVPGSAEWKRVQDVEAQQAKAEVKAEDDAGKAASRNQLYLERAKQIAQFAFQAERLMSGLSTGLVGSVMQFLPASDAKKLVRLLDTVKSNIGFSELQAIRDAAKTGGALGQVSDFENRMLQSTKGSLEIDQGVAQLRANVSGIRRAAEAVLSKFGRVANIKMAPGYSNTGMQIPPEVQKERDEVANAVKAGEKTASPGEDPAVNGARAGIKARQAQAKGKWSLRKVK